MSSNSHGTPRIEIETDGPAILEKAGEQEKHLERSHSQLEAATRATFGVLNEAKERTDLPLILESVDRVLAIVEMRRRLALQTTAKKGGGGHG